METQAEDKVSVQPTDLDKGVEGTKDQLLEIYKLHAQLMNQTTQRQVTINRFYQIMLFGVCILVGYLFNQKEEVLWLGASKEKSLLGTLMLGIFFSVIWLLSVQSYLQENFRKHEVLKNLEGQLAYQFLIQERKIIDRQTLYSFEQQFPMKFRESFLPVLSVLGFSAIVYGSILRMHDKFSLFSLVVQCVGLGAMLCFVLILWLIYIYKDDP